MGISTGWSSSTGGFQSLDEDARQAIWLCFESINLILAQYPHITRVVYSCDKYNTKSLGYALFKPSVDVTSYIEKQLQMIPQRAKSIAILSKTALSLAEDLLERRLCGKSTMTDFNELEKNRYVDKFRKRKRVRVDDSVLRLYS